jgi:hypothetical protein
VRSVEFEFHFIPCQPGKKRKISGLDGLELQRSLTLLRKLRKTLVFEGVSESDPTPTDTLGDKLDKVIALLESRTHGPLVRP